MLAEIFGGTNTLADLFPWNNGAAEQIRYDTGNLDLSPDDVRDEASSAKRYVLQVDHFSNEHLYVEKRYRSA